MSPTVTILDQLDCDISVAYLALGLARSSFDRCPSARERTRPSTRRRRSLDRLLDERFAAQQ